MTWQGEMDDMVIWMGNWEYMKGKVDVDWGVSGGYGWV